jgi:non-ribosomal peptide synthetase component F
MPDATMRALREAARVHRVTVNTFVQGAWALVLSRLSGNHDVVFGATSAGRPPSLGGVETILGLLITTVPVRVEIQPAKPVIAWLRAIQEQQMAARDHEHAGEDAIRTAIGLGRDASLFSSIVRFQNYPVDAALRQPIGRLRVSDFEMTDMWPYPLCLVVQPGTPTRVLLTFDRDQIADEHAERVLEAFLHALTGVVSCIDNTLSDAVALAERQ